MIKAVADPAGMRKIESVLDFAVNRVASAGNQLGVCGRGHDNFVGARSVKAKTAVSFVVAAPDLTGIEDRGNST